MDKKITDIIVLNRKNIQEFATDRPYLLISIRDPKSEPVVIPENPNQVARLDLDFYDIDCKADGVKSFCDEDAKAILKIVNLILPYVNLIVCQCEAGVSRSAGVAAALSKILTDDDSKFFAKKGPYCPNSFVYRTILNRYMDSRPIGE
jgi:predicted protein tyrosine phosphatase